MESLKKALEANGYRVVDADSREDLPVVECRVRRFNLKNYTWVFPIVPTWGGIDLDVQVVNREGKSLWTQSYSGGSWNLWFSFSSAVNSAMAEILEKAVEDFGSDQFREACCLGASGSPS
jgi:hypothetical protein